MNAGEMYCTRFGGTGFIYLFHRKDFSLALVHVSTSLPVIFSFQELYDVSTFLIELLTIEKLNQGAIKYSICLGSFE